MNTGNSYQCQACGQWVMAGSLHMCPVPVPIYPWGQPSPYTVPCRYTFTPNPLTADEVRKIVREELERARKTTTD